jgi:UDP-2,3-diacylglucosamine hydrolase
VPGFTAFISDLHLSAERPAANAVFFAFLRDVASRADALYILGDLFEYWAGDDDLGDPFNAQVAAALRQVAATLPVWVMHGNRDFLLTQRFAEASGARLLADPSRVDLYGTPTLLMHGDLLCTQDRRYQAFRAVVRNRLVQALFMRLPLARRKQAIGGARRVSEGEKQVKQMSIMDVSPQAVEQALRAQRCERLIHGHTHRPARHEHRIDGHVRERWVLSDWYVAGEYLRCTRAGCERVPLGAGPR